MNARTIEQQTAADPRLTVWVAANAGSGKTAVLTDRVIRLLLAGAAPHRILCLTFTKAAAAEMANRLSRELARWTAADDAELKASLNALDRALQPDAKLLRQARQLFARALEAPGGLRFQTIHAFCEALLKRFPLEAGVAPNFHVADDADKADVLTVAKAAVLQAAEHDPDLFAALEVIATETDEVGLDALLNELARERGRFAVTLANGVPAALAEIAQALGLSLDETTDTVRAAFNRVCDAPEIDRAIAVFAASGKTDQAQADRLRTWRSNPALVGGTDDPLANLFYTGEKRDKPRVNVATKTLLKSEPWLEGWLDEIRLAHEHVCDRLARLNTARRSRAALVAGAALFEAFETAKRRRALLDFDDLIQRTRGLLAGQENAAWVRWKLDQGIDHVLVDEAQDTNQEQWDIVNALSGDFYAGAGARDAMRTLFVVGDEKQSIFSFQGADPEAFGIARDGLAERVRAMEDTAFREVALGQSFRSVQAVLDLVDAVFAPGLPASVGVLTGNRQVRHIPFRRDQPGLVELWDPVEGAAAEDGDPWDAPLDRQDETQAPVVLARRIAEQVRDWLRDGETIFDHRLQARRPVRAADIMVLVRKRGPLFDAMVTALKRIGVPLAGADRIKPLEQLAVQDLLAIGDVALLPQNDLQLAVVLKGPLCGFTDDDDLFPLAHERGGLPLWAALSRRRDERPAWTAAAARIHALTRAADRLPPYEFFAELLGQGGLRKQFLLQLGPDAADPIDEFLAAALNWQQNHPPSLQNFLAWFRATAIEIKRDLEQERDEVRVLTVHAAKGLEAGIVILPDTNVKAGKQHRPPLVWQEGTPLWYGTPPDAASVALLDADLAADERELRRLLYVALTRARDRLYVCVPQPGRGRKLDDTWYDLIRKGLESLEARQIALPDGLNALRHGEEPPTPAGGGGGVAEIVPLPPWSIAQPAAEPIPSQPLAPSRLPLAPAPFSPRRHAARFKRGNLVHKLLQFLPDVPAGERVATLTAHLAQPAHGLDAAAQAALAAEVLAVLEEPAFAAVFAPGSRAEVPLVGRVGRHAVSGQIDRLAVTDRLVLAVDYKTNRPPPTEPDKVSPAHTAQMALYRALLTRLFPGRTVQCALLWTDGPRLMPLPDALLDASLAALDSALSGS